MEIKKSEKADLQSKKFIFTQIGLLGSLLIIYAMFSANQGAVEIQAVAEAETEEIVDLPPVVRPEEPRPQEKILKVVAPTISSVIEVVDNTIDTEDSAIFNPEADEDLIVYSGLPTGTPNDGEMILDDDVPVFKAEIDPDFQGAGSMQKSNEKFRSWVQKNVRYPSIAEENNVTGAVNLKFIIGRDGKIKDITVLSSPDRSLTEEVQRVLRASPAWNPGKQRDKPVAVHGTIRIVFTL